MTINFPHVTYHAPDISNADIGGGQTGGEEEGSSGSRSSLRPYLTAKQPSRHFREAQLDRSRWGRSDTTPRRPGPSRLEPARTTTTTRLVRSSPLPLRQGMPHDQHSRTARIRSASAIKTAASAALIFLPLWAFT